MRFELFEIHDQPWFPDFLRREVVDALQMILERTDAYRPIARRLRQALNRSGNREVLDLFSGAGGPWPSLVRIFESEGARPIEVFLTDKFPNVSKGGKRETVCASGIHFLGDPVDATVIPERLQGFRTIFSSFHHLNPEQARRFLQDSVAKGEGVGVFEVASRHAFTLLVDLGNAIGRLAVYAVSQAVSLVPHAVDVCDPRGAGCASYRRAGFLLAGIFARGPTGR